MKLKLDREGIYEELDEDLYHAHPFISKSKLDVFNVTPYHYYRRFVKPSKTREKPSQSLARGSLIHLAVLEPARFLETVVMGPSEDARKKEFRDFKEYAEGKIVVKPSDYEMLIDIVQQIKANKTAYDVIRASKKEVSLFWMNEETQTPCRGRIDALDAGRFILTDVKSTRSAEPRSFFNSMGEYRYHVQAAFYSDGIKKIFGLKEDPVFNFVAVETAWPYIVQVYEVDPAEIELGRAEYHENLRNLKKCYAENTWPGYGPEIMRAELPKWYDYKIGDGDGRDESGDSEAE